MFVKVGDNTKIESVLIGDSEKPQKCPKCGKKLTTIKLGEKIELICDCEEKHAENID